MYLAEYCSSFHRTHIIRIISVDDISFALKGLINYWSCNTIHSIGNYIDIELILCYTLPLAVPNSSTNDDTFTPGLMISFHIPYHTTPVNLFYSQYWTRPLFFELRSFSQNDHTTNFQCYITRDHKDTLDWDVAYKADKLTNTKLQLLLLFDPSFQSTTTTCKFSKANLLPIEPAYHQPLLDWSNQITE